MIRHAKTPDIKHNLWGEFDETEILATTEVAITPAFAQTQSVIIDPADTAWMITATGFVPIPGL